MWCSPFSFFFFWKKSSFWRWLNWVDLCCSCHVFRIRSAAGLADGDGSSRLLAWLYWSKTVVCVHLWSLINLNLILCFSIHCSFLQWSGVMSSCGISTASQVFDSSQRQGFDLHLTLFIIRRLEFVGNNNWFNCSAAIVTAESFVIQKRVRGNLGFTTTHSSSSIKVHLNLLVADQCFW